MENYTRWIFISPHYDDVILSCAGLLAKLGELNQKCIIITVFGGGIKKNLNLSELIKSYVAEDMNCQIDDVTFDMCNTLVKIRKLEDIDAIKVINGERQVLDYSDAIYRGDDSLYYYDEKSLFGNIKTQDINYILLSIVDDILLRINKNDIIFFPNSIGNHVDHQIIKLVAYEIERLGFNSNYYNEYPYMLGKSSLFNKSSNMPISIDISNFMDSKIRAIQCYNSQISGLFGENGTEKLIRTIPTSESYVCNEIAITSLTSLLGKLL